MIVSSGLAPGNYNAKPYALSGYESWTYIHRLDCATPSDYRLELCKRWTTSFQDELFSARPRSLDHFGPQFNLRTVELIHALRRRANYFGAETGNALFDIR